MISTTWSRKLIAAGVAVAVLSVYSMVVLASPGLKASGELSVSGVVTVNGQKAISGGTLFSDSVITTAEKSSVTVSISKLGRVELAPNSSLHLSFTGNSISGLLETGSAHVVTLAGVSVNIATKDGSVIADGSNATALNINTAGGNTILTTEAGLAELRTAGKVKQVAAGESAVTGTPNPQPPQATDTLSGGKLAAVLIAAGGALAVVLFAALHNNDINFGGGSINVISPTK
jgi:hypothetical protein